MSKLARYDSIAAWYGTWVAAHDEGLIAAMSDELLPSTLEGASVLDVACGHGRASRAVARLGARVVGVDVSAELINSALAIEANDALGITYRVGDVADLPTWWDGTPFDGALCEMAVMDIDDFAATVRAVASTVRPGAWFVISMVHPCFPGNEAGLSSWPPDRSYFDEGRWTSPDHNPDGVRGRVGSTHRMLSTILNTLIDSRFTIERVVEPPAPVPTYLLIRCKLN